MDNLISFQRVIDRQDQTPVEGRFNYWNYTGDITTAWYTGILHRTRTRRKTTCLVGHPSIEATPAPAGMTTISQDTSQETDFASSLRIAPGHSGLHRSSRLPSVIPDFQDYQPPTSTTDYFLGKINQMGTHLPLLHYIPFGNQPDYSSTWSFHCHSCTLGGSCQSMQSSLATIDASIMEVFQLRIQFCVFIVLQYTPNY